MWGEGGQRRRSVPRRMTAGHKKIFEFRFPIPPIPSFRVVPCRREPRTWFDDTKQFVPKPPKETNTFVHLTTGIKPRVRAYQRAYAFPET